jgi:predicted metal-dependent hydrolase
MDREASETNRAAEEWGELDIRYRQFFERFNSGEYFEAHEVLEGLWLKVRAGEDGAFYKGLIQVAGAFVHVKRGRFGPALSLLDLADQNLSNYAAQQPYLGLDVRELRRRIEEWRRQASEGQWRLAWPRIDLSKPET